MKKLENFTQRDVFAHLVLRTMEKKEVDEKTAKELVLNALTYNVVVSEIMDMIDYLLEEE